MPKIGLIRLKTEITTPNIDIAVEGTEFEALKIWRPRIAEAVSVVDKDGLQFRGRVMSLTASAAVLRIFERMARHDKDAPIVTLLQAMPDKERMELVIQKATELGVDLIVPIETMKSTLIKEREAAQKKAHKWPEVALKAAKQCRRTDIPEVAPFIEFDKALKAHGAAELKIILDAASGAPHIKNVLRGLTTRPKSAAVLVGPEGGFDSSEVSKAQETGFILTSLGPRILRTETAAIAALSIIRYELG